MNKLIAWNMITINGLFTGPERSLDWFVFDDDLERYILETQETAGTVFFGRVTYEMMAAYWPSAEGRIADFMHAIPKVVFSRTLTSASWNNTRVVSAVDPAEIDEIKRQSQGDVFIFGSADFSATLVRLGLIDEYRFGINPVFLERGTPWFKGGLDRLNLSLIESRSLKSGVVIHHYVPVRKS